MDPVRNPITEMYFGLLILGKGLLLSAHRPPGGTLPVNGNRALAFPKLTYCPTSISNDSLSRTIFDGFPATVMVGRNFAEEPSGKGMIWWVSERMKTGQEMCETHVENIPHKIKFIVDVRGRVLRSKDSLVFEHSHLEVIEHGKKKMREEDPLKRIRNTFASVQNWCCWHCSTGRGPRGARHRSKMRPRGEEIAASRG